jgi:hypothetical protein
LIDLHSSISEQNNNKRKRQEEGRQEEEEERRDKGQNLPSHFSASDTLVCHARPCSPLLLFFLFLCVAEPQAFAFFDRLSIVSATLGSFMHEVQAEFALELGA